MKKIKTKKVSLKKESFKYNVIKGKVLGIEVYRGFAKLSELAKISKADVFDQKINPHGTQRDLSPKHAKDAYNYVKNRDFAFWAEVFLCVRNSNAIEFILDQNCNNFGLLKINSNVIKNTQEISISRVDGNHRLHFASGEYPGYPSIDKEVSFCIAYDLTSDEEIKLFRDINDNQKRMNTSHLDNIEIRLTTEEKLKRTDPALYIAKRLGQDKDSTLFNKIFEGGRKPGYFAIPLRSLKTGIQYMLSQPSKLTELPDIEVQYLVIRNYFNSVKKWQPDAWIEPNQYYVLRGVGLWAICFIGSSVIDRVLSSSKHSTKDMYTILDSGKKWDWTRGGEFAGYSGRGGAVKIRDMVVREFADESGVSIKSLADKILKENN